jgi:Arc/MetJ-type ribon-helix-helix transcriptional regulator
MSKAELEHLGIKVSKKLNQKVTLAVDRGEYATKSDLVRTALRALLREEN